MAVPGNREGRGAKPRIIEISLFNKPEAQIERQYPISLIGKSILKQQDYVNCQLLITVL